VNAGVAMHRFICTESARKYHRPRVRALLRDPTTDRQMPG